MRNVNPIRVLSLFAVAASIAACGDGTAPVRSDPAVDSLLADVSAIDSYSAMGTTMLGLPAAPSTRGAAAPCVYAAASQSFVCEPVTSRGVTVRRSYQLLDASGTPQSAFNQATTAAIRTVMDAAGTVTPPEGSTAPAFTMTIESHSDQTLSGLLTTTRTVNGTGTSTSTMTSQQSSFTVTSKQKTENLVLPVRGSATPYPSSGKITVESTVAGLLPGDRTMTTTIVMTYNGTSIMTMTLTSGGMTTTCLVNLATPAARPICTQG